MLHLLIVLILFRIYHLISVKRETRTRLQSGKIITQTANASLKKHSSRFMCLKIMRRVNLILTTILSILFAISVGAEDWSTIDSAHFVIYHIDNQRKAREVRQICEDFYVEIVDKFRFVPDKKIEIWICDSEKQFRSTVNAPIQDWAVGCAYPLLGRIVIQNPTFIENQHFELSRVLKHEIVHVILGLSVGDNLRNIPVWFNEGLAMYFSEGWSISRHWLILGNVITKSIIPLESLSKRFPKSSPRAQLAYAESHNAVSMMVGEYGWENIHNIIREIAKRRSFPQAFFSVTGVKLNDFESKWRDFLNKRYKWVSVLSSSMVIWIVISVTFIFVYLKYRQIMRRKMEEWEQEENQTDEFFEIVGRKM